MTPQCTVALMVASEYKKPPDNIGIISNQNTASFGWNTALNALCFLHLYGKGLSEQWLSEQVLASLERGGANVDELNQFGLSDALKESQYEKALTEFSSQKSLEGYISQHFDLVEPIEYVLGLDENGKEETFQYVPVLDTIRALLTKEDVFAEVFNNHFSENEVLKDYCDGLHFKQNALFSAQNMSLQVQLYFDEFNVANPLGNKVQKMKFGGFYFVLGNISPKYRSKLHVIQLATLCLASHLKKYDMNAILAPLLRDIHKLETEGVCIQKDDISHTFYGTISFISADNRGAHFIGGFQTHFNSGRICRGCNVTSQTLKDHFNPCRLQLRTKQGYEQQVRIVHENPDLWNLYGLKHDSVFNYFHITCGLPHDIAHDLFEGVVPEVIEVTIKHCVQQGYFSLLYFNDMIKTFPYGEPDIRNKPTAMSCTMASFRVKQTASQAWCLLRLLPLMIGHTIPYEDSKWLVLLSLLDVVEYIMAPRVTKVTIGFLTFLIEMFLSTYYREYDITMKPKAHYLLHYPEQMHQFGPLVFCWTLRFEGKHFFFKEVSCRTKNRKNLCKTMAERHEYHQAWLRSRATDFLTHNIVEHTGGKLVHVRQLSRETHLLILSQLGQSEFVYVVPKVAYNGIWYTSDSAVVLESTHSGYKFAKIDMSFIITGIVFNACRILQTQHYIPHIHAYAVSETNERKLIRTSELADHQPLAIYNTAYSQVVVLRHHIV
ncbi:uncharacterized protein [Asterias amurensis]|uniref:uncharacterized protein n=1 Tax=Asterias amurensis TaxID=7602 RepID=UPI003AB6E9DB